MRTVRGRADARWMPSRFTFALFRLFAFVRLRNARPECRDTLLVLDHYQSNGETWAASIWLLLTGSCYIAAGWLGSWPVVLSLPVALLMSPWVLQACMFASAAFVPRLWRALTRRDTLPSSVNSFVLIALLTLASARFATHGTWVRFVAYQYLAVFVLNMVAALILLLLRDAIARLEESFGGSPSAR